MVKCGDCGREISGSAKACPGCGAPQKGKTSRATWLVGSVFAVLVGSCVFGGRDKTEIAAPSARPSAAELAAKEKDFQTVVAGARWLKGSTKNPASFELVSAGMVSGSVACYEYRGTNSFNAVVLGFRVITDKVNSGDAEDWNKFCAGKPMIDYTHARQAL